LYHAEPFPVPLYVKPQISWHEALLTCEHLSGLLLNVILNAKQQVHRDIPKTTLVHFIESLCTKWLLPQSPMVV
jgi:hypothetical protein